MSNIKINKKHTDERGFSDETIKYIDDQQDQSGIDFKYLIGVFRRHILKAIIILLCTMAVANVRLSDIKRLYTARAEIIVQEQQAPVDLGEILGRGAGAGTEISTEILVVRSREIMAAVVDQHDLLRDPEFNWTAAPPPMPAWERWLNKLGVWPIEVNAWLPPDITIGDLPEPPSFRIDDSVRRSAIRALQNKTRVGVIRGTSVIWIAVTAWDPQKAALLANAIAEAYGRARAETEVEAQRLASQFIGERVLELQSEVEVAEGAVQSFRAEHNIIDDTSVEISRFEEVEGRLAAARALRQTLEDRLARLESAQRSRSGLRAEARALDDRTVSALLEAGYEGRARREITRLATRLQNEAEGARRREGTLQASRDEISATLEQQGENLVRLRQLEREAAASRVLLETFLTRQREAAAQQSFAIADMRILTRAEPNYTPSSPNSRRFYILHIAVGLVIAAGLIFLIEKTRNKFMTPDELESWSGMTILGLIPVSDKIKTSPKILEHIYEKPNGLMAESVRSLRTSILLADIDQPPQIVTVTSSVPGEGKSLTAAALALVTAQMGKRAILIDTDLRRRVVHKVMKISGEQGLISVLNGSRPLQDAIKTPFDGRLHVLPVEENRVSAPDLLSSQAFERLLNFLREHYDFIVLDAPPVLPVTDARILGKKSDVLIYMVKWNSTPKDVVENGLSLLRNVDIHINGLVMTQVNLRKQKRYGYNTYGYSSYGVNKYYQK